MAPTISHLAGSLLPPRTFKWRQARSRVIRILLRSASSTEDRQAAWRAYQDAAEAVIRALPDDVRQRALIGLKLDQANIWQQVGYTHQHLLDLTGAEMYARNLGNHELVRELNQLTAVTYTDALEAECEGRYDDAINLYMAVKQLKLPEDDRAQLELGIAYCYLALIEAGGDRAKLGPFLEAAIESALSYIGTLPGRLEVNRLRDEAVRDGLIDP